MHAMNQPRRARSLSRLYRVFSAVAAAAMLLALVNTAVLAGEGTSGGVAEAGGGDMLLPISDRLSASAWSMVTGLDPRENPDAAQAFAPGGGAPRSTSAAYQQVPFRSPSPAFSRNVIVSQQVGLFPIQTEPHIVVDPADPEHIVLGVIDYNFPSMVTYVSFDGGETWDGPNQVRYFRNDNSKAGDPVLAFDSNGVVYITSISRGFDEFRLGNISSFADVSSMVVARSYDGGLTWLDPVSASRSGITTVSNVGDDGKERGTVTVGFLDKPWIATGPNPDNADQDSIYLTYTDFETTYGIQYLDEVPTFTSPFTQTTIRMVRSDDGGVTWTDPIDISPTYLSGAVEGNEEGEGGAIAEKAKELSAPEGEVEGGIGNPETSAARPGIPGGFTLAGVSNLLWPNATPLTPDELAAAEAFVGDSDVTGAVTQDEGAGRQEEQQSQTEALEADRTVQGSQPAVMPDGTLVVAYLDTTNDGVQRGLATIQVVVSKDGGRTLTAPIQAGTFREPPDQPRNAFFRFWGTAFPQIAVGKNNEIYIGYVGLPDDKPTDDGDFFLLRSLDGGATWEAPNRVNQDQTDHIQFFPSITVSPNNTLHLMWADMRDDPEEARYHIYYTKSEDEGATFGFTLPNQDFTAPDTIVSDFASNSLKGFPQGLFLGDYFSIAASDDDAYLVWADTRLGEYGGPSQQVAFARQSSLPAPSLFLSPPSGAAGRTVDVQGFGFQPNTNVFLQIGGITVSNLLTDDLGQFTTQIAMPIGGEGATEYRAYDDTGNNAIASFYTDFGFDSVQQSLEQLGADTGATASPVAAGINGSTAPPRITASDSRSEAVWLGVGALAVVVFAAGAGYLIGHRRERSVVS